ncbi:MAG: fibronectin type III-like domain-contianing protein, partial [Lachnospiraceae bacterium]|nr:fibronectin type III-like domain-contianing protein [Lachnospiraceae bacterium]
YSLGTISGDGFKGIDYDEGIYVGYKYFETVFAEIAAGNIGYDAATGTIVKEGGETGPEAAEAWWQYAVVYPFGYGLSYTTFEQSFESLYYLDGKTKVELSGDVDGDDLFSSAAGSEAKVKTLYADVLVTNTGDVAGKQVVQIYVTAPYTAGGIEKAHVSLVGFAKTGMIRPGKSEKVTVAFNVQDAASFDYNDINENEFCGYELEAGEYIIKVMEDSHRVLDEKVINLTTGATLGLDDFSGNEIDNVFSKGDMYDTIRKNNAPGEESALNFNASDDAAQVLLSRVDLTSATVQDLYAKEDERTMSDAYVKSIVYWNDFTANNPEKYGDDVDATEWTGAEHFTWYKTEDELKALMAGWTQVAAHEEDYSDSPIKMKDMSGIDIDTEEGAAAWLEFMNQLTYADIVNINNHGSHTTAAIPAIGKVASKDENGPNSYAGKSWCCSVVFASTWNLDLAWQYGVINANLGMLNGTIQEGWYGPGMDYHRSPFGGRNNEYYSQDGIQGGYIAAAQVGGAQSRGLNVYIKHIFMNDQESARSKQCLFTWASEQAIRELYAKPFQMAMQEGGATSAMTAYNRIGGIVSVMNDALLNQLIRDEWGWKGQYVTDFYTNGQIQSNHMDLLLRAGCDLPDGTASGAAAVSGTWKADAVGVGTADAPSGNVVVGVAAEDGSGQVESLAQWYYARKGAERVLYVAANTLNNRNGVSVSSRVNTTVELQQGAAANGASIALDAEQLNGNEVTYALTGGELPAGVSLNAATGALTGTPTGSGTYNVTVSANIAGWIKSTINSEIIVKSAFTLSDGENDVEAFTGKVGVEFEGFIDSDVITSESYNQGISYAVAD